MTYLPLTCAYSNLLSSSTMDGLFRPFPYLSKFKCLTSRCIHIDLLPSLDTDSFLMSFCRFVAQCETPFEIICDHDTYFIGRDRELQEAFDQLGPALQEQLARYRVRFVRIPPHAPHFGETWWKGGDNNQVYNMSNLGQSNWHWEGFENCVNWDGRNPKLKTPWIPIIWNS